MRFVRSLPFGSRFLGNGSRGLLFSVIVLSQVAFGATYYVSPSGSDSNPGTSTQPYQTIARGVQQAAPGDTIILQDGTYGNQGQISDGSGGYYGWAAPVNISKAGTSSAWITIKAQNPGNAILDCGTTTSSLGCDKYIVLQSGAGYWSFQGLVFTRGAWGALGTDNGASNIQVIGCTFENIGNWNDSTQIGEDGIGFDSSAKNWLIQGNVFHDIGRIGGSSLDHGMYAEGTNITVINNVFYNITHGWSIQMANGANSWLIANNTFAFPNPTQNGHIMMWNTNTNITIENNIFYNPQGNAIERYTSTVNGCTIGHNLVYGASSVISDTTGCTVSSNLMGGNPNFVNASTAPYNFQAQSGGAGIDAGMTISQVPTDFMGVARPQGSAYDIGAYEFSSGSTNGSSGSGPVISGVAVSAITSNSAVVTWTTNVASTSAVQYGPSSYSSATPTNSSMVTLHSVQLTGLQPGTLYHFQAISANSGGNISNSGDNTFSTSGAPAAPSFTLSTVTPSVNVTAGSNSSATISATLVSGSPGTVSFSTSSLPYGVTASFSQGSCNPTCSTVLTLSASSISANGTYAFTVSAGNSSASSSLAMKLTIGTSSRRARIPWVQTLTR